MHFNQFNAQKGEDQTTICYIDADAQQYVRQYFFKF